MRYASRDASRAGFTLVEVLIATTLLGLLSTLLFGGVQFGTRVWGEGERHLGELEEIQAARTVLRRVLSQAIPLDGEGPAAGAVLFHGTETRLDFVGPAPAQSMPHGLYRLRLHEVRTLGRRRLVLAWQPADGADEWPSDEAFEEDTATVLLDDVADLAFLYFGSPTEAPEPAAEWRSTWTDEPELPRRVRIAVALHGDDRRFWIDLDIPLMIRAWHRQAGLAGSVPTAVSSGGPATASMRGAGRG